MSVSVCLYGSGSALWLRWGMLYFRRFFGCRDDVMFVKFKLGLGFAIFETIILTNQIIIKTS